MSRFVLSKSKLIERYEFLKGICPNVSYSLKTNPEAGKNLEKETDCMFSVHTIEGLSDIKDLSRVLFIAEALSEDILTGLFEKNIRNFVVDNESDLEIFLTFLEKKSLKANLFLRMKFQETTVYKGRYFLFGMDAKTINKWIPKLRENKNIEKLGIHFHRQTQNKGNWSLKYMLEESLSKETLNAIDTVNIGGGIPVKYKNATDSNLDYIVEKISELKDWLESQDIEMMIEPGRPLAAPPVKLEATITSVSGRNITVDCSVYNTSMDTIIVPFKMLIEGEGEGDSYIIKGCTPCSMDIFRYDVKLNNPKVGDKITFLNAGAYNFTTTFCNLKKPDTVVIE